MSSKRVVVTFDIPEEFFDFIMAPLQHFIQTIVSTGKVPTTVTIDGEEVE